MELATIYRRFLVVYFFLLIGYIYLEILTASKPNVLCFYCDLSGIWGVKASIGLVGYLLGFSASVSFTRLLTIGMAHLCGYGKFRNFAVFCLMLVVNYTLLVYWSVIIDFSKIIVMAYFGFPISSHLPGYMAYSLIYFLEIHQLT
jgi:hypothetical protein